MTEEARASEAGRSSASGRGRQAGVRTSFRQTGRSPRRSTLPSSQEARSSSKKMQQREQKKKGKKKKQDEREPVSNERRERESTRAAEGKELAQRDIRTTKGKKRVREREV